jgi:hypothetical protein
MTTKKTTTSETKPTTVERIVTSDRGVGRLYKETSGIYVVHARRQPGGFRTRRRFSKLAEAKASYALFVEEYRAAEAKPVS